MNANGSVAVKNAICQYVAFTLPDRVTDEDYKILLKFIKPTAFKGIDDQTFLKNKRLVRLVDYERLDRQQVIRLMTRNTWIFENINLDHWKFFVKEVEIFLRSHPQYVRNFNFDINLLTGSEIIILLKADLNYLYEIDFNNKKFSRLDFQDMIKYFANINLAMEKLNFEQLDNFQIRTLILNTKAKYINELDLTKLNALDWLAILEEHPKLINHCPIEIFETGDYFNLVKLVCILPELYPLIEKNRDNISALGWEKLILRDYQLYEDICQWHKLREGNWKAILNKRPFLRQYKQI